MAELEKVIRGLECCLNTGNFDECPENCPYFTKKLGVGVCSENLQRDALSLLKAQEPITGETSDGYHTFNELYHHRAVLFSVIVANYPDRAWKSKKHYDGTMYEGMFIVGIETPDGQATYHYDIDPYWDMFKCRVLDNAPEWDGHTPAQAIERIGKLKAQEPRMMTLEEVKAIPYDADIWIETEYYVGKITIFAATINTKGLRGVMVYGSHKTYDYEAYNKLWRCWTSRPTDEQRKAVKWDDNE